MVRRFSQVRLATWRGVRGCREARSRGASARCHGDVMGWFSKKRRGAPGAPRPVGVPAGPDEHDPELTFFGAREADRFRALVRRELAEMGWEVTVLPGSVVSDDGRQWGLWNVAAL